jgi:hypothetical protein
MTTIDMLAVFLGVCVLVMATLSMARMKLSAREQMNSAIEATGREKWYFYCRIDDHYYFATEKSVCYTPIEDFWSTKRFPVPAGVAESGLTAQPGSTKLATRGTSGAQVHGFATLPEPRDVTGSTTTEV